MTDVDKTFSKKMFIGIMHCNDDTARNYQDGRTEYEK